ncbi:MAG: cytochrome c biogenesis protein [Cryomorphaceae bacterium]|nr:cytochrome c biogenesis protein [Cryomorphaceae bacterium]
MANTLLCRNFAQIFCTMVLRRDWWKILAVLLVGYTIVAGLLGTVPRLPILNESIRNLYFHVTMWFVMLFLFTISVSSSIAYLSTEKPLWDIRAELAVKVGMVTATLGILTGMIWANFTWGKPWVNDPKLNGAAVSFLGYAAYLILRQSIDDSEKKARIAAVYNIFAFVMMIVFIQILPRLTDSLHPGSGGNPAFSSYDLDKNMRIVFYPAVIGWFLIGYWIYTLQVRMRLLQNKLNQSQWND